MMVALSLLSAVSCSELWSNCTFEVIGNHTTVMGCSAIQVMNESTYTFKFEDSVNHTNYYPFFDTTYFDICHSQDQLFNKYRIESCSQLFCQVFPAMINRTEHYLNTTYSISDKNEQGVAASDFATMMNYCQYCKRDDFTQFHTNISQQATCFRYASAVEFCNYGSVSGSVGKAALIHGRSLLVKGDLVPWICYCKGSNYGFKCDHFSTGFLVFTFQGYPIIALIVSFSLVLATIMFNIIPMITRNYKRIVQKHKVKLMNSVCKSILEEIMSLNWLIVLLLCIYFALVGIENILNIATIDMFKIKSSIGKYFHFE